MKEKVLHFIFLFVCVFLCICGISYPVEATEASQEGEQRTVKVAFYPLDGFFEYDEEGKECGYGVDFLNELSKYANIQWEYVPVESWEEIENMMQRGEVDVRMPATKPSEPSSEFDYTLEPVMTSFRAIMTLKNHKDAFYQDYAAISKMKIAIAPNMNEKSGVDEYLSSIGVTEQLVTYPDYNSCKQALDNGEVDALISNIMDLTDDMKILDKFLVTDNYITRPSIKCRDSEEIIRKG